MSSSTFYPFQIYQRKLYWLVVKNVTTPQQTNSTSPDSPISCHRNLHRFLWWWKIGSQVTTIGKTRKSSKTRKLETSSCFFHVCSTLIIRIYMKVGIGKAGFIDGCNLKLWATHIFSAIHTHKILQ